MGDLCVGSRENEVTIETREAGRRIDEVITTTTCSPSAEALRLLRSALSTSNAELGESFPRSVVQRLFQCHANLKRPVLNISTSLKVLVCCSVKPTPFSYHEF